MQLALFDLQDMPALVTLASSGDAPGSCYVAHFFQRSGLAMWKLGYTEASPFVRAKQIACVPVAWWPGSLLDERRMHRQWKHNRVSPAAEFFEHGDAIDRWVLRTITQMPLTLRAVQLEVFAQIMLRIHGQHRDYGDVA